MAIDFPTSPTVGQQYIFGGVTYVFTATGVWATAGASAIAIIGASPQGRLTLQTGVPVMITTQSAKTTIFYTPYNGNLLPIYDGTNMVMMTFAELSVATTDTIKSPAAIGASKVNDWFVWSDAGTLRLGHGPDWTSDTVRSAGTALVMVNGIWLNNASITNGPAASRGTYVGTTRSNASSQLDWILGGAAALGTAGFFGVWNCYNRVTISTTVTDTTSSWTHTLAAWRAANASSAARVSYVCGLQEDGFAAVYSIVSQAQTGGFVAVVGIGYDSTTAPSGSTSANQNPNLAPTQATVRQASLGFHFLQAIEFSAGPSTSSFYGLGLGYCQSGLFFDGRM